MPTKTYDIKADFGAFGDGIQAVGVTVSIATNVLTCTTPIFSATIDAEKNKYLAVSAGGPPGFPHNGNYFGGLITASTSTTATLTNSVTTPLVNSVQTVEWGHDDGDTYPTSHTGTSGAFEHFNQAALAWQLSNPGTDFVLNIPAGIYELVNGGATGLGGGNAYFANGIKNINVVGDGINSTFLSDLLSYGFFVNAGAYQMTYGQNNPAGSPPWYPGSRVNTVQAGSTTVQMKTPLATGGGILAEYQRFNPGDWAVMQGVDMQGFGLPQNPEFFEFVQIVTSVSSGLVTFTAPLKYTYKETWPIYNPGNVANPDLGGPASLFPIDPTWDLVIVIQDLTLLHQSALNFLGRDVTALRVVDVGGYLQATASMKTTFDTYTQLDFVAEVDKMIGDLSYKNSHIRGLKFFSNTSMNPVIIDNCIFDVGLNGTPSRAIVTNSTIPSIGLGVGGTGYTSSFVADTCTINSISDVQVNDFDVNLSYSATNGGHTIVLPSHGTNAGTPVPWTLLGEQSFWSHTIGTYCQNLRANDITQDASNAYVSVDTTTSVFPVFTGFTDVSLTVHPCLSATFINCVGCKTVVDQSQASAHGLPWLSYTKRGYCSTNSPTTGYTQISYPIHPGGDDVGGAIGRVVYIKINVETAYNGFQNPAWFAAFSMFANYPIVTSDGVTHNFGPFIDLRTPGLRTITPAGATFLGADGGQVGSINTLPTDPSSWLPGKPGPDIVVDLSDAPFAVTLEILTDQSFPSAVVQASIPFRTSG